MRYMSFTLCNKRDLAKTIALPAARPNLFLAANDGETEFVLHGEEAG